LEATQGKKKRGPGQKKLLAGRDESRMGHYWPRNRVNIDREVKGSSEQRDEGQRASIC